MDNRSQRSQISIYILVGFIILILVGLMLYIREIQIESLKPDSTAEDIPLEIRPVKQAVEDCLRKVSHEAFDYIGLHGGYLDPLNEELSGRSFYFDLDNPVESSGVTLFDERNAVPYWYYVPEPSESGSLTITNENIPEIDLVNNQVRGYILNHMTECLDQYKAFGLQGFNVTELPGRFISFDYAESVMFLDLIYPLEVRWGKDGELVTRIDRFSSELPFNFMDVFGVAFALSQSLTATQSLEDATMHALVLYSGLDSDKLPPFSADSVNGEDKVTWSLEKSKKMIKDVLMLSVNMFQVEGLRDSELIDVPGSPGLLKPFLFDLFQDVDILDHINVEFIYLDWPVYSNIWPADDDKLVPKTIKGPDFFDIITGDETYKYRFFYDLSYPVLIRVILEDIPFKDGRDSYSFYFAHEVSLRRNLNLFDYLNGQGRVPLNPGDVEMGTELVEEQIRTEMELSGEEEFLEELDSELMTDKAKDSLICNEEQRIGPERTFVVYDKYTNAPISNADVQFTCGRYVTCKWDDLNTELDLVTNLAETTTNLPMCRGEAFMVFSKEGYVKNRVKVNVDYPDDAFTQYVEMSPIVNVEIVDIDIIPALNFSGKRALADDELISIKFQRVTEYTDDDRLATSLIIRNDQPILSLPLAPGLWKVEGSLVDEAGYYIDATRRCDCGSDDEMMDICEREKETLRTGVPENCKVDTVMEDGAAVKVCGCLHINGSVDSEALDICDGVKDTKLWFFENGSDSAYADCEVVQDYVANFTHVGPNAEVGGVYFTGINRSVYWNVSYNSLVTHRNGLIIKIVDFPRPENDNEIDMLNMRGKFENYGAYAHYSRPYFS